MIVKTIIVRTSESSAGYSGKWRVGILDRGNRVFGNKKIVLDNFPADRDGKFEVRVGTVELVMKNTMKSNN